MQNSTFFSLVISPSSSLGCGNFSDFVFDAFTILTSSSQVLHRMYQLGFVLEFSHDSAGIMCFGWEDYRGKVLFSSHYISVHTIDMTNHSPGSSSGQEFTCQCRRQKRCKFHPWVGKIPWRRKWQPAPVFLSGTFHRQKRLAGYSP